MTDKTAGEVIAALVLEYERFEEWSAETMAAYSDLEAAGQITEEMLLPHIGELFTYGYLQRALRAFRLSNPKSGKKFRMPLRTITAAELLQKEIPPVRWIVDKILPVGLTMISAPPKYFKSWLALDLCLAVALGRDFLGFQANKCASFYMDLESTEGRTQDRIQKILGKGKQAPPNMIILNGDQLDALGLIGDGFEEQFEGLLDENPEVKFVAIDVLELIRKSSKSGQNAYDRDYGDLRRLKKIADRRGVCVFLVHHTNKSSAADPFDRASGSTGMTGAMDTAWTIIKDNRDDSEATIKITGRDVEPQSYRIKWEKDQFYWNLIGTEEEISARQKYLEYDESPITNTIRALVKDAGSWEGSAADLKAQSKFTSHWIQANVEQVGKFINAHLDYLEKYDEITTERGKRGSRRFYKFHCPTVQLSQTDQKTMTI